MSNPRSIFVFVVSLAACASVTGCKRVVQAVGQAAAAMADAGAGAANAAAADPEDDPEGEKLNAYIDCLNGFSSRVHDTESRYFSWADAKKGPTGKERYIRGLYKIDDPSKCVAGMAKAKAAKPSLPELEQAGDAYGAALTALVPVVSDAYTYYDQSNYKDDKMAKGMALHPKLVAAFEAFDKADDLLHPAVDTLNRQVKERELAAIEKAEGKKIPYWRGEVMLLAQDVVKLGDAHKLESLSAAAPSSPKAKAKAAPPHESQKYVPQLDLAAFTGKLDEFEKAMNELQAYMDAHKDEASKWMMLGSFVSSDCKNFLVAAKDLMRRVRDKEAFSSSDLNNLGTDSEWMVRGSPGKLVKSYNELVAASNGLHRSPF